MASVNSTRDAVTLLFNTVTASVDQGWSKVCNCWAGRWTGDFCALLLLC